MGILKDLGDPMDPIGLPYGGIAEALVSRAAAWGGQPDFVFPSTVVRKGRGSREIGDCLIWVGDTVLVVSVKSRDPSLRPSDNLDRTKSWIDKAVRSACKQIDGTIRKLQDVPGLRLRNMRGVEVPWDPGGVKAFLGVVVLDCTVPNGHVAEAAATRASVMTVAANDWSVINEVIWSSSLLVKYVETRVTLPPAPLASELDMFGHVIEADQSGSAIVLPDGQPERGMWGEVQRRWPDVGVRKADDGRYALVLDVMMASLQNDLLVDSAPNPWDRIEVVRILDSIPVLERIEMGRNFLDRCHKAAKANHRDVGLAWPTMGKLGMQIVFMADGTDRQERMSFLCRLAQTRHTQLVQESRCGNLTTLGIATEPWPISGGSHDFVYIPGSFYFEPEDLAIGESVFGRPTFPGEVVANLRQLALKKGDAA